VVGCSACAKMCPMEAIRFPTREEMIALMRELMQKHQA
jgi:ferredoxin